MARNEKELIALCRDQIERKFPFGNGHGYSQRDLEVLAETIENKSGVIISLSTLKRLWKGNFKQSPQLATLNALVLLLDYNSWHEFKLANADKPGKGNLFKGVFFVLFMLISCIAMVMYWPKRKVMVNGPVHFSAHKTVTTGIPNTVIFEYDVSKVEADSFYIQQSWNDHFRTVIDPGANAFSSIYYESGYHRARLYADDSLLALQPVHILSEGWEPHVYYSYKDPQPITFKGEHFITNGQLHLSPKLLKKRNVDFSRYFFSRISNSQEFNLPSDNFSISTRMKVDSLTNRLCPWMQLIKVTQRHIFWVNLQKKGCEQKASYKLGEIIKNGNNSNLSLLGVNTYQWQDLRLLVKDRHAQVVLNGEVAYKETFQEDFGNVVGLIYLFDGTGSIDRVNMSDITGNTIFEDDFY